VPTIPIVIGGEARSADLPTACLHYFEKAAHLRRLILGLRGVDPLAQAGDSQIILHPDEPLDLGNLCMKRINLLLNEWPNHFGLPQILRNLAPTLLLGAKIGIGVLGDASGPLCGSGTTHSASVKGKLLASDSLRHKALDASNSPENSFCDLFVIEAFRGIVIHGWRYHVSC